MEPVYLVADKDDEGVDGQARQTHPDDRQENGEGSHVGQSWDVMILTWTLCVLGKVIKNRL